MYNCSNCAADAAPDTDLIACYGRPGCRDFAAARLLDRYNGLINKVVWAAVRSVNWRACSADHDDARQAAMIAFLNAASTYDPAAGSLAAYAGTAARRAGRRALLQVRGIDTRGERAADILVDDFSALH